MVTAVRAARHHGELRGDLAKHTIPTDDPRRVGSRARRPSAGFLSLQPSRGTVIGVSSISDLRAHGKAAAYGAAKGAILAATRATAVDLGEFGIRVNAVSPGPIYVENWDKFSTPDDRVRAGQQLPLRRIGTPDDVAGVVAFLASADAAFITGQTIYIDGGLTAQARPPSSQPT